ncbi:MAG: class A beta-lactamase-related serine hydrolase [candidate division KSB1 bacterium]|nr:class A beta-lactamase-related serine hydrolase [candidate division KSB1 bacterium]
MNLFAMKKIVWCFVLNLILVTCWYFTPLYCQDQSDIALQMRALERSFGGRLGIMAKNLKTGQVLSFRADEKFPTASAIKLPIMVEYFYQVAEGKVHPTQKMVLADSNKWGGSGLYQYFFGTTEHQLIDAVMMMITISDNTATNLVIDALGKNHQEKLSAVNDRMRALGLKQTRLLNKLMSWVTKTDSPESIRYGVGVSTPEDMVLLLEKLYRSELVDSMACQTMIDILAKQQYNDMIPRFLPIEITPDIKVAHKTGGVTSVRVDVGLVLSSRVDFAVAIFCDQIQDHRDGPENLGVLAAAYASRIVWNAFTGDKGLDRPYSTSIDWNSFPSGEWCRVFLRHAPFPHGSRSQGHQYKDRFFPFDPHYCDSSAVIVIPRGFHEVDQSIDLIVHFHGWNNDVLNVMEQFNMVQQLIASNKNAILIFAQGPYRASDSGGGKMEDEGGLKRFVEEILQILKSENRIHYVQVGKIIISAHSGGYRPAILSLVRGGMDHQVKELFLFDAFYDLTDQIIPWLRRDKHNRLRSIYTDHLAEEHQQFIRSINKAHLKYGQSLESNAQIILLPTDLCHICVIEGTFQRWLEKSCLKQRMNKKEIER